MSNLFDHYDFLQQIPDPLTRDKAASDPSYLTTRKFQATLLN